MTTRGAILQFEVDVARVKDFDSAIGLERPFHRIYNIAQGAAWDTIKNGGTFVLVVTTKKITMVQRPDAEEI